jgi:tRNA dimethylallyltransferase
VPAIELAIRERVRSFRADEAYAALREEDPAAAHRLRPTDTTRIARALEVVRSTGRPLADWQREKAGGIAGRIELRPLILLPPRQWLYERCDARFADIFSDEGIAEVRALLERRLNPLLPVMRAIGVREIASCLEGSLSREEAMEAGRTATRRYAKRQYTWFSRQPPEHWPRFERPLDCDRLTDALARLEP